MPKTLAIILLQRLCPLQHIAHAMARRPILLLNFQVIKHVIVSTARVPCAHLIPVMSTCDPGSEFMMPIATLVQDLLPSMHCEHKYEYVFVE